MGKNARKSTEKPETKLKKIPNQLRSKLNPVIQKLLHKCTSDGVNMKKDLKSYREIYSILQEIRKLEQDYVVQPFRREEHWKQFYEWCLDNGAKFSTASVKEMNDGDYGLIAEKDLKEGDNFLSVPRKTMLSVEDAQQSKLGPLMKDDLILKNMLNVSLSIFLVMEALNEGSFWLPYISILPSAFNTVLYYSPDELELLQRSPVVEKAINTCQSVARQYAYFNQLFQKNMYAKSLGIGDYFTYDLYRWAVSAVMTRQNAIPTQDSKAETTVLIPLWDMCNHVNGKFSTDFNLTQNCLDSFAMKDFSKGEEVYIFYGPRSNAEFLLHNGFVYPHNENDKIELKLNISKSDPLAAQKIALCSKEGITLNGAFELKKGDFLSDELLTFLKIYIIKEDEIKEALESEDFFRKESELHKEMKQRALKFLKDRATLLLKSYGTTIEEDENSLKATSSNRCQMAIQLRICEKKLLTDCMSSCEQAMAL